MSNTATKGAVTVEGGIYTRIADGAVSAHTVVIKSTDSSDGEKRCKTATAHTDMPIGVALFDAGDGDAVTIQYAGIADVIANAAITEGAQVAIGANTGKIYTAVSGDYTLGVALADATNQNDRIDVLLTIGSKVP